MQTKKKINNQDRFDIFMYGILFLFFFQLISDFIETV